MQRRQFLKYSLAAPVVLRATFAHADDYPTKSIRMIVPFAAGGTSDVIVRHIAERLSSALKQPILIENRVGANGTQGLGQGLRAAPDGYTIIQISNTNTVAAMQMMSHLPFDPLQDMASVGSIYQIPTVVLATNSFPANNFAEFLKTVKANPGRYAYAYSHATGAAVGASVVLAADMKMTAVPYSSGPQAINDLVGGHIPLMFTDIAIGLPLLESRQLKVFAISSPNRSKLLPELPTFTEALDVPIQFVGWGGFVAPAKTPKSVLDKLNSEMNKVLSTEEASKFLQGLGAELMTSTPAGFDDFIRKEAPLWIKALKAANIEPQ